MEKETFLKCVKSINKIIFKIPVIKDLLNDFGNIKEYFINHPIEGKRGEICSSFFKTLGFLGDVTMNSKSIYPDYVSKMEPYRKKISEFGTDLSSLSFTDLIEIVKFNCLATLFLCTVSIEFDMENDFGEIKKLFNGKDYYFRGQDDSKYGLLPTFYRNLETSKKVIDNDFVKEKYIEYGFYKKFDKLFSNKKDPEVDYKMMSYVQHCAAFSPLLDLTSSINIATIFSCAGKNMNPNEYMKKKSSLFIFRFFKNAGQNIESLNIRWIDKKLDFHTEIEKGVPLFVCSPLNFETQYSVTTECTNDRMKYQKGAFLYVNKGFVVNGHLLIPSHQILIIKININPDEKKKLYLKLSKKYPYYGSSFLMDPYSYLGDFLIENINKN